MKTENISENISENVSENIYLKMQDILTMIDAGDLPGIHDYLSHLQGDEEEAVATPYAIVSSILELDKPKKFPDCLIDFITGVLEAEIAAGSADAMNDLGAMYYEGYRGFEQNFEKAMHYYHMAAANGNRAAQENLGYCYYYGRNGDPDYEKAFHYFALGAFDGHLISLYKIGDMYLNGLYVEKNEKEAFYIFMRCIETMTEEAEDRVAGPVYLRLGRMFLEGIGTGQNLRNALICFQKAELFLCDMVLSGDAMYRKSLQAAVAGQKKVREKLADRVPENTWEFD